MTDQGARCPQCHVTFRVTPTQLQAAGGRVRCGFCLTVFDAGAHPTPLAPEPASDPPPWLRDEREWHPDDGFDRDRLAELLGPHPELSAPAAPPDAVTAVPPAPETDPEWAAPPWVTLPAGAPRAGASRRSNTAILLAGTVFLALQALYFQADRWNEDVRLQPLSRVLCAALPCRFASLHPGADAFRVEQVLVRPLPPDGLRLDAMLANRGARRLALPAIRIEFEDLDARLVAARTLQPDEYLAAPVAAELAAGQSLHLVLDLHDPGPEAVSYRVLPQQ